MNNQSQGYALALFIPFRYPVMKTENQLYLENRLRELGFPSHLNGRLDVLLKFKPEQFHIEYNKAQFRLPEVLVYTEYKLEFNRAPNNDTYSLDRYRAQIYHNHPRTERHAVFPVANQTGVRMNEAFNLLDGRAVRTNVESPDGSVRPGWLEFDFNQRTRDHQYAMRPINTKEYDEQLKNAINPWSFQEWKTDPKQVLNKLHAGELVPLTLPTGRTAYVTANPQQQNILAYNIVGVPIEPPALNKKTTPKEQHAPRRRKKGKGI